MPKYRRVARQEFPSTDPARRGQIDVMYVYVDERFQTVSIRFPLEQDSPEKVAQELRLKAQAAAAGGAEEVEI